MESGYLRIARRRWPALVACVIVGLAVAFGVDHSETKSYQANSEVFINVLGGNSVSEALDAAQLSAQLIESYAYVAESSTIAREVQTALNLSSSPSLGAAAVPGTLLLDYTAIEPSPALAESVLTQAMRDFTATVKNYQAGNGTGVIVRIVEPAAASDTPVSPRRDLDLVYGGISGLVVGIILAALLQYMDKSFRDPSELEGLNVGPLLVEIPRLKSLRGSERLLDSSRDPAALEAYASLRASLRFLDPGKPLRSILFTSPVSGDGKTTTVANLVDVLAKAGEVTVGVDADLRNPKLAQAFGVPAEPGLTSVVIGAEPLGSAVRWNAGLGILPTGPLPPNPSEILGSQPMANLIQALAERADKVLIDGPAVLAVSDPITLAPLVEGVVLVLKPGSTRRDDIVETCRRLEIVGARTVGYVLNSSSSRSRRGARTHYSRHSRASEPPPAPADLQLLSDGSGRTP
jgi:capsular exopolysaccharide synthesis family protein